MSFGGASKWTEDYIRSLPTAGSLSSLGSTYRPDLGKEVRVGRKIYEWFGGGDGGSWEEVLTIPDDYSTDTPAAPPEETGSGETSSGIPVMVPHLSSSSRSSSPVPSNPYYPQLVQEYDAPGLVDYSAYMPADSLFGYEQYQPWTNPNDINDSIWNYQPPTIYASDPRAATGVLATPGGIIEGGHIRPTVGIEAATSSSPSTPVGSAGYPPGDPRNPEDRGGPDRPDDGWGADSDTQTKGTPTSDESRKASLDHYVKNLPNLPPFSTVTVPTRTYPNTPPPGYTPAPSYPNTPPPGLAEAQIAAEIAAAQERANEMVSASDWAREQAAAELSKAVSKAIAATVGHNPHFSAMPAGLASHPERAKQEREMDIGYFGGLGASPSGGGGSSGAMGGAPGGRGEGGHSRK